MKFIDDFESMKESFFSEINSLKMEMLQPNTKISESTDSAERLIKQLQDEIIFLREELRNKNITIKCVLDQLSKRDGAACSSTECHSYRESANDSILSTNEKKAHNKSGEIHTDEKDLLNNSVLLHEQSTEPSKSSIRVPESSTKQGKPMERKEQNMEFVSASKQSNGQ